MFFKYFFEEFYDSDLIDFGFKLKDIITHGRQTNSLMVVSFKNNLSKYDILDRHQYTVVDYTENIVKLYNNPDGEIQMIPMNILIEIYHTLRISYTNNKIFKIPKQTTTIEFVDYWKDVATDEWFTWLNTDKTKSYVDYDLIVEEDDK